nr:Holliday junction recognition protein [Zonotrichia albicollis]
MEFDPTMQEGLRNSSARFMASMTRIIEEYSHPFRDDVLISIDSLTYDTPEGPKRWELMSRKDVKTWKKGFTRISRRPRSSGSVFFKKNLLQNVLIFYVIHLKSFYLEHKRTKQSLAPVFLHSTAKILSIQWSDPGFESA